MMRDWRYTFIHVPLQEVGNILIKSIRIRIQKYDESKRICAYWWIALCLYLRLIVFSGAYLRVTVRQCMGQKFKVVLTVYRHGSIWCSCQMRTRPYKRGRRIV